MSDYLNRHWAECDFAVVDLEGNGQTPQEIIEIAVVPIVRGEIEQQRREWMVLPQRPVTARATRIHGISNVDLIGRPRFSEIADEVTSTLQEHVLVGHNVSVDVRVLKGELVHWSPPLLLDTLKLARWVLPGRSSYALASLVGERGISAGGAKLHRAAADAFVTARLFLDAVRLLDRDGLLSLRRLVEIAGVGTGDLLSDGQQELF